jgi:hypothetical protein
MCAQPVSDLGVRFDHLLKATPICSGSVAGCFGYGNKQFSIAAASYHMINKLRVKLRDG